MALTVTDYDQAVAFYRDRLGLPVLESFEVADSAQTARRLADGGAEALAEPVVTPWRHRNVRLRAPDGMQLTLFTVLDERDA